MDLLDQLPAGILTAQAAGRFLGYGPGMEVLEL